MVLAFASTVLTLAAIEGFLRWQAWRSEARAVRALASAERPRVEPGTRVSFGEIIVASPHHDVVYKLQNNLKSVHFCRELLSTNSLGFRSPEVPLKKEPGQIRIVGIGDSVMMGFGVSDGENYLSQAEKLLNEAAPGRGWQTINTAVSGYNTCMEVATLEHEALRFDPDIVIYGYCLNDAELPRFLKRTENYMSLSTSYLLRFLTERRLRGTGDEGDLGALVESPHHRMRDWRWAYDPSRVPREYAHMVGEPGYQSALDRLRDLGRERGFEVVVLVHPPPPPDGDAQFEKRGFAVIHTQPYIDRWLAEHHVASLGASQLIIGRACTGRALDFHPSADGHQLIAQAILDGFDRLGYLRAPRESWAQLRSTRGSGTPAL